MIESKSRAADNKLARPSTPLWYQGQTIALAVALCAATQPLASQAQTQVQEPGALHIEASGFDDGSGHAIAKLFLPGQNVRQRGRLEAKADIG